MSQRFIIKVIPGTEAGSLCIKTKTRVTGSVEEIEKSLRDDFENGLMEQIIKIVAKTYGTKNEV